MADIRRIMRNAGAFFDTVGLTALAFPLWYMALGPIWGEYHPEGIDTDTWQEIANWEATNFSWASRHVSFDIRGDHQDKAREISDRQIEKARWPQ